MAQINESIVGSFSVKTPADLLAEQNAAMQRQAVEEMAARQRKEYEKAADEKWLEYQALLELEVRKAKLLNVLLFVSLALAVACCKATLASLLFDLEWGMSFYFLLICLALSGVMVALKNRIADDAARQIQALDSPYFYVGPEQKVQLRKNIRNNATQYSTHTDGKGYWMQMLSAAAVVSIICAFVFLVLGFDQNEDGFMNVGYFNIFASVVYSFLSFTIRR